MKKLSMRMKIALGVALSLLPAAVVYASDVVLPFTFTAGTPIKSADVNANFAALRDSTNSRLQSKAGRLAYVEFPGCTTSPCLASRKFNSMGGDVTAVRTSTGNYTVTFVGLAAGLPSSGYGFGSVTVNDFGDQFVTCKHYGFSVTASNDVRLIVSCYKNDIAVGGTLRAFDGSFTVQAMF